MPVRSPGTSTLRPRARQDEKAAARAIQGTPEEKAWTDTDPHSLAPYEKRVIELLRNSKDKRARRLAKKRVQ